MTDSFAWVDRGVQARTSVIGKGTIVSVFISRMQRRAFEATLFLAGFSYTVYTLPSELDRLALEAQKEAVRGNGLTFLIIKE